MTQQVHWGRFCEAVERIATAMEAMVPKPPPLTVRCRRCCGDGVVASRKGSKACTSCKGRGAHFLEAQSDEG